MPSHPQLREWGLYESVEHPLVGSPELPALPFRFRSIEKWASRHAPLLGQDNARVLREVLGMGDRQIEELRLAGVIGDWPANL